MRYPPGTVLLDPDFGTTVVNGTEVSTAEVYSALERQERGLFQALEGWVRNSQPLTAQVAVAAPGSADYGVASHGRDAGLYGRDRYVMPRHVFDQMRLAYHAVETDDVVSAVADATESLAFTAMSFYAENPDEQDVYNQIAAQIDLDSRMREIWRELFTVSQCYVGVWWEKQTFKVRGETKNGNARRRSIECRAPQQLTILDPLKIIPVGSPMFGKEQLAYIAEPQESSRFREITEGRMTSDAIFDRLIARPYEPATTAERRDLSNMGVNVAHLWLLNPENVFRHTLTRPGYQRVSAVRMKTIFELLDLKQQLRQMERATLIGATNYIVLINKGSDKHPAQPSEMAHLQTMVRTIAQVPILIGDHRLSVQIVTPKVDFTLQGERHDVIDGRITARLYQMFVLGRGAGAGRDNSENLIKVIARGMESRRHMIRRTLERQVFRPMFEGADQLTTFPKLQFHPASIALDFDPAYASFLFDLRQARELSRETMLNQFDLDQGLEAEYLKRERDEYDDIFRTQVPFSTPNTALPQTTPDQAPVPKAPVTRRDNGGGRRNGGGSAPGSGQGQPPRRRTRPSASDLTALVAAAVTEALDAWARNDEGAPDEESD